MGSQPREINRIKIVLVECNISQKKLAHLLGKDLTIINRYCSNKLQPPLGTLAKIADLLQIDIRRLLHATPDINKKPS